MPSFTRRALTWGRAVAPLATFLLIALSLSLASSQDGPAALRYKLDAGQSVSYNASLKQTVTVTLRDAPPREVASSLKGGMRYAVSQAPVGADGAASLELVFTDITAEVTIQGETRATDTSQFQTMKMGARLTPSGEVRQVLLPKVNPPFDNTLRLLQDAFLRGLPSLPAQAPAAGLKWSDEASHEHVDGATKVMTKRTRHFTLEGLEDGPDGAKLARIKVEVQVEIASEVTGEGEKVYKRQGKGSGAGVILFDAGKGLVQSQELEVTFESEGAVTGSSQRSHLQVAMVRAENPK